MIIGIDNGLSGGIGVITPAGEIVETYVMPSMKGPRGNGLEKNIIHARQLTAIIRRYPEATQIAVERPRGGQDINSVMSMADSFATIRTIILCLCPEKLVIVGAWEWQREYWPAPPRAKKGGPPAPKFDTKHAAAVAIRKVWPGRVFLANERCTVSHDGIIDALLIAEFIRRQVYLTPPKDLFPES